jgi:hypothetical protein
MLVNILAMAPRANRKVVMADSWPVCPFRKLAIIYQTKKINQFLSATHINDKNLGRKLYIVQTHKIRRLT